MKRSLRERRLPDTSGKLHIYCPYQEETGINIHVVLKGGFCYRSKQCKVLRCKFNHIQSETEALLSLVW